MDIIECHELSKSYGGIRALDSVSLRIREQAAVGLVGPNGAGKTTLFSILCGFLTATRGSVTLAGQPADSRKLKGRIGILPQDTPLLPGIPAYEQLLLFARLQGFRSAAARQEINGVISLLGIAPLVRQLPETLSHGQRKKVCLAQALIGDPGIMFLDEPTAGLDPVAADEVRKIMHARRGKQTLVISSHNLDEIRTVCDEVIILDRGKMIRHSTINELIARDNTLTVLLDRAPGDALRRALEELASVIQVTVDPQHPYRLVVRFNTGNPDELQFRVFACLQQQGAGILEFSRGSAFTDKVVELVRGH